MGVKRSRFPAPRPVGGVTPYINVDRINYDNETPWPSLPDGQGPSVAREVDAVRWQRFGQLASDLADGTPGLANGLPPLVFTSTFTYAILGPTLTIKFNKDVGGSLVKTDLVLRNLTTNQTLDLSGVAFDYNASTQTATWTLPSALADGNYLATLTAAVVTDENRQLDGNADGTAGDDFTTDFFHLAGDINHDRSVDFLDLAMMAQNYNSTGGMTWGRRATSTAMETSISLTWRVLAVTLQHEPRRAHPGPRPFPASPLGMVPPKLLQSPSNQASQWRPPCQLR